MYTLCPGCRRQFRIYAEQIAAAAGQVRCGFCNEQFNALERLQDQPLPADQLDTLVRPSSISVETSEEPQFEIPDDDGFELVEEADLVISKEGGDTEFELQRSIAEIGVVEAAETATPVAETKKQPLTEPEPAAARVAASKTQASETLEQKQDKPKQQERRFAFQLDESALEEEPVESSRLMNGFWSVAGLVAVIVIAIQLTWFNRDRVLLEYPQLRPYLTELCEKLDCSVIRERNTQAIKLVNRDVRLHPSYEDTLLVNATMENELPVRQPYPHVQLTLFDTAGALIGFREFLPSDYLDSSIDTDQGMPVDAPVHFVLEVAGSSEKAVSFEFRFL